MLQNSNRMKCLADRWNRIKTWNKVGSRDLQILESCASALLPSFGERCRPGLQDQSPSFRRLSVVRTEYIGFGLFEDSKMLICVLFCLNKS